MRCEEIRRKFDAIVEFSDLADFVDRVGVLYGLGALTLLHHHDRFLGKTGNVSNRHESRSF